MFVFQLFYYLFRPEDKARFYYLILLILLLFYNVTGGLFPDPSISIPVPIQEMVAYGSGFLMASYFPFYFYKAFDLKSLRWHALYGVPLFLLGPYIVFFVIDYALHSRGTIAPGAHSSPFFNADKAFEAVNRSNCCIRRIIQHFDQYHFAFSFCLNKFDLIAATSIKLP